MAAALWVLSASPPAAPCERDAGIVNATIPTIASPTAMPRETDFIPCPMTSRNTSATRAPSATWMPISVVRCVTA